MAPLQLIERASPLLRNGMTCYVGSRHRVCRAVPIQQPVDLFLCGKGSELSGSRLRHSARLSSMEMAAYANLNLNA